LSQPASNGQTAHMGFRFRERPPAEQQPGPASSQREWEDTDQRDETPAQDPSGPQNWQREPLEVADQTPPEALMGAWSAIAELSIQEHTETIQVLPEGRTGPAQPELAGLVATRRAVREALVRLDQPTVGDADLEAARAALRQLEVLTSDPVWTPLQAAAGQLRPAGLIQPAAPVPGQPAPLEQLLAELVAEATSQQPGSPLPQAVDAGEAAQLLAAIRQELAEFVAQAQRLAAQPPAAQHRQRAAWVAAAKLLLEKAVDLLLNLAVAAALTLPVVQLAAQRAAQATVELAEGAVGQLGPALPWLLALTAVAAQAALGVKLVNDTLGLTDLAAPGEVAGQPDDSA
jgi:hypothetical protein